MTARRGKARRARASSKTFLVEVFRVSGSATVEVDAETMASARREAVRIVAEGMLTRAVYLSDRPCGLLAAHSQDVAILDRMKRGIE